VSCVRVGACCSAFTKIKLDHRSPYKRGARVLDNDVACKLDKVAKYGGQGNVTKAQLLPTDISCYLYVSQRAHLLFCDAKHGLSWQASKPCNVF
jgi:hypothetical protein